MKIKKHKLIQMLKILLAGVCVNFTWEREAHGDPSCGRPHRFHGYFLEAKWRKGRTEAHSINSVIQ